MLRNRNYNSLADSIINIEVDVVDALHIPVETPSK